MLLLGEEAEVRGSSVLVRRVRNCSLVALFRCLWFPSLEPLFDDALIVIVVIMPICSAGKPAAAPNAAQPFQSAASSKGKQQEVGQAVKQCATVLLCVFPV